MSVFGEPGNVLDVDDPAWVEAAELKRQLAFYRTKCHRHEDCPVKPLVDELNRVKWLLNAEERGKVNAVLDAANPMRLKD